MTSYIKTLRQLEKASHLVNRTFHKNGPKSYKHGVGALIKVLYKHGGSSPSEELIDILNMDRKTLKNAARKGTKAGFVTIACKEGEKGFTVQLTETGKQVAEKRINAQDEVAEKIMAALSEEEIEQLQKISDKLIVSCKALGAHGKHRNDIKSRKHNSRHHGCCEGHSHKGHGHRHGKCHH